MRRREIELQDAPPAPEAPTLKTAIDRYQSEARHKIGRTKAKVLDAIRRAPLAGFQCDQIASAHVVEFATALSRDRTPATVANCLSHLGAVFAVARPAWGYPLDPEAMKSAHVVTRRLGISGKSMKRERRPTVEEITRLAAHFEDRYTRRPGSAPMHLIMWFALFSTRRQEEITLIAWADLDRDRVLIRDMKNPGEKIGNNVWCDLPAEAVRIIEMMPRTSDRIFPFSTDAISAAFTRACKVLGIEDLHFHDLRHEGVSRLFEMGWTIPHVAAVSGHRSWSSLQRYTHIRQSGDKWQGLFTTREQRR